MFYRISATVISLVFVLINANEPIPTHLLRQLKNAISFEDVMSVTNVVYKSLIPTSDESVEYESVGAVLDSHAHNRARMRTASFMALPRRARPIAAELREPEVDVDDSMRKNLDILSSIRQGNDTCTLQNICVPVPVDNPDPSILVFPRCYEITQCVGSCCDSFENCHPTAIEYLQKPIVEMVYAGHNRFLINQTLNITMQQHRACSCRDCALEGPLPECDGGQVIGPSCTCECSNQMQKTDCKGVNKYWNEDTCTCGCQITHCPRGTIINRNKCACDGLMRRPHDGVNFRSDASKLPRLRSYVRARPGA